VLCSSDNVPMDEVPRGEQGGRISAARPTMLRRCPKNPERRGTAILLNIAKTWLRIAEQDDAAAAQQQQQSPPKGDKE
jgi:hypothetical protein